MSQKILLFDIETTPNLSWTWGKWEQNVIEFEKEWQLLSFAYKWLGKKKTYCFSRRHFKSEGELVSLLHSVLSQADIAIAHNGNAFDMKKARAKFIEHGLKPLKPITQIDTKLLAKKYFNFNSNSLNDICRTLGLGKKVETGGFELWKGCMRGELKSYKLMEKYNKADVVLLEKVYLKLRSWVQHQPGIAVSENKTDCPNCGGKKIVKKGTRIRRTGKVQTYQCQDCGGWF